MPLRARKLHPRLPHFDPARVDELIAVLLLIEIELQVWLNPYVHHRVPSALGGAVLAAAVAVRRRWPLGAVLVALGAVMAQGALGGQVTKHTVGALVASAMVFYASGAFLPERRARLALAIGLVGGSIGVLVTTAVFSDLLFLAVFLVLLPWAVGRMLCERGARERAYRERAERLDGEREQRTLTAAWGERARIARELHDVIAHSVSVMVIQAGAARMVMVSEPDRAEASLRSAERAGREALAEMRRLLSVLDGEHHPRALTPQPGLADLEDLISRTRAAGLLAEVRVEGEAETVSPALDLCAYRIVQEALTNAIKHAGPARAVVCLRWARDTLELEIADDGHGPVTANGFAGGHGIVGMRERATLHGGSIQTGSGADGGFTVLARLPLAPEGVL